MSQTKPLGLLLATLVLFVLRVQSQRFPFRPDARLEDPSFRGPGPFDAMDYDEEEDEGPNLPFPDDDGPGFPDEDYPDDVDEEYEDEEYGYPNYPKRRPYGSAPYRRRGYSRYDDDGDYSRSRRRDHSRRYGSDSGGRYSSRNQRTRYIGKGGYRKPHSSQKGKGNSRYGGSSRNTALGDYRSASSSYGSRSKNAELPVDLKEVAQRVRNLIGSLRNSKGKKEDIPSEVVNAM